MNGHLSGEDKVVISGLVAIACLTLVSLLVTAVHPEAIQTIVLILSNAITPISILVARHPPQATPPAAPTTPTDNV